MSVKVGFWELGEVQNSLLTPKSDGTFDLLALSGVSGATAQRWMEHLRAKQNLTVEEIFTLDNLPSLVELVSRPESRGRGRSPSEIVMPDRSGRVVYYRTDATNR